MGLSSLPYCGHALNLIAMRDWLVVKDIGVAGPPDYASTILARAKLKYI